MALTTAEQELCSTIQFEPAVAELLKAATNKALEQLKGFKQGSDAWGLVDGLSAKTTEDKAQQILAQLQPQLPAGYNAFYSERNFHGDPEIAVIKSNDRLDIVRLKGTSAGNYDLSTDDIAERLQKWQQLCKLNIAGAGHDWVLVEFETLPDDLNAFGQEIYDFCPDTIDQHFGCMGEMAEAAEEAGEELPEEVQQLMAGLDWDDPDTAGMELLKASLRQGKSLFLWWD